MFNIDPLNTPGKHLPGPEEGKDLGLLRVSDIDEGTSSRQADDGVFFVGIRVGPAPDVIASHAGMKDRFSH